MKTCPKCKELIGDNVNECFKCHYNFSYGRIINQEEPSAFVYVGEAYRVMGKGFSPLRKVADTTVAED